MLRLANYTKLKLPLIQKGRDAEKAEAAWKKEVNGLKTEVKSLKDQLADEKKEHDRALKAERDAPDKRVDAAVKAALENASPQIIQNYKESDEFMNFSLDYLGRGVRTTAKWASYKEQQVGSLKSEDFVGLWLDDPLFGQSLQEVELASATAAEVTETVAEEAEDADAEEVTTADPAPEAAAETPALEEADPIHVLES